MDINSWQEIKKFVLKYAELLKEANSECSLFIMPPYPRAKVKWSVKHLEEIHETLRVGLASSENIKVINYLEVGPSDFVSDGLHLTPECQAKQFAHVVKEIQGINTITPRKRQLNWSDEVTSASKRSMSELESGTAEEHAGPSFRGRGGRGLARGRGRGSVKSSWRPGNDSEQGVQGDGPDRMEGRLDKLAYEMVCNWEATDTATNKLNLNVVIIDQMPITQLSEAKDVAAKLVLDTEVDISNLAAAFFMPGRSDDKVHPRMRIIFKNNDAAYHFRTAAFRGRKEGKEPWKSMYVSNDSTRATRVRVEILKKIGEAIKEESIAKDQELFVNKFEAKPMLLFKKDRKVTKRIPYPEAIRRWGRRLNHTDLALAKKIAGRELADRFDAVFGV